MKQEEEKIGPLSYIGMCADTHYAVFNKASETFWDGPIRHGNNRHSIAKEKVSKRRTERKRNNRSIKTQIYEE